MTKKPSPLPPQCKTWLTQQPHEALVALLLDVAKRDVALAQTLRSHAPAGKQRSQVDDVRQLIDDVTTVDGSIDWGTGRRFAKALDVIADTLVAMLRSGQALAVAELALYAVDCTENALQFVDDSSGKVGDVVVRLGDLHLQACQIAQPDPVALAQALCQLEATLPFGLCSFSASRYSQVLGAAGLQAYQALAQAQWESTPALDERGSPYPRKKWQRVLEDAALAKGDIDGFVVIKASQLTCAYDHLKLAEALLAAQRPDEALKWAELGLQCDPARPDNRLRNFVAARYVAQNRPAEALQLTWLRFEERPGLAAYQALHSMAEPMGQWPAERTRALNWLAQHAHNPANPGVSTGTSTSTSTSTSTGAGAGAGAGAGSSAPESGRARQLPDVSSRVEIALWEGDLDAAWEAIHRGSIDTNTRQALAQALEPTRAREAVVLYRQIVADIVAEGNAAAYARALSWLRHVQQLMAGLHESALFAQYLTELKTMFAAKRSFIKGLDEWAKKTL